MALFCTEAERLTLPRLKQKIVATNLRRGPSIITSRLPCVWDPADVIRLLWEDTSDVGVSLIDQCPPCTSGTFDTAPVCSTPNASRASVPLDLGWKMMQRFADVCDAHVYDQRFFNRQQVEINKQYQYVLNEWNKYAINGLGWNSLHFNGLEFFVKYVADNFRPEVEVYGTSDGTSAGTPQPLILPMVRKLLSTVQCGAFDALIMDVDTNNALMTLLEVAGGNTAPMQMAENFGVPVMSNGQYAGVPMIISDDAGDSKRTFAAASATTLIANDTLTIAATEVGWIGFSRLDVGREVRAAGATFGGAAFTTIAEVLSETSVRLTVAADAAIALTTQIDFAAVPVIYAVRFSEDDGFHFRHPAANGSAPDNGYPCLPAVCGLGEISLGHLQSCPTIHRTTVQLRGNFGLDSSYAVSRLSHFERPTFS